MAVVSILVAASCAVFTALALWALIVVDRGKRRTLDRLERGRPTLVLVSEDTPRAAPKRQSWSSRLSRALEHAGLSLSPGEVLVPLGILALALYGGAVLFAGISPLLALPIAVAIPAVIAHVFLRVARARYVAAFTEALPEALDVFARGLRAGRPVAASLGIVVDTAKGPLKEEMARVHAQLQVGTPLTDSLARLNARVGTPEVGFFAIATALQAETGGNLIETLENLAAQLRERRKLRKKTRALTSEARASAFILAALPFAVLAVLAVLNAQYLEPLFTDPRGQVMGTLALLSVGGGIWIMAAMGRVDG